MSTLDLQGFSLVDQRIVTLNWEASTDLVNVFKTTSLSIRYDSPVTLDADIAAFIFCAVIVPCYAHTHDVPITISFPEYVTTEMLTRLKEYHRLTRVTFSNPANGVERNHCVIEHTTDYAIFYGGGKDSLLSAAIHEDMYGSGNVTLLRLVWDEDPANLPRKREIISSSLSFMSERGFRFEYVESNFHAIIHSREVGKIPNIALYPGLMSPLIARRGFKQISHGYDAGHFHMPSHAKGKMPFAVVRPEKLKLLAIAMSSASNSFTVFKNYNYGFNAGVAFKFLAKAYPAYLPNIYMCERLAGKWCLKCRKCFFYAIGCLAYKCESDFNLGYFFQHSEYIKELVKNVDEAYENGYSIIQYVYKFAYPTHLCSMVQLVHDVDLAYARERLWHRKYPEAFLNLIKIIEPFKNYKFPDYNAFWVSAYEEDARELGNDPERHDLRKLLTRIKKAGVPISDKTEFEGFNRNLPVKYKFSL